jgi:hypothetical protein
MASNGTAEKAKGKRGRPQGPLSAEHLEALAKGRRAGPAIRNYLATVAVKRPRGRKPRSADEVIPELEKAIANETDPLSLVKLHSQLRREQERAEVENVTSDPQALEDAFVEYAAWYSTQHGIAYADWRMVGVPAAVLKRAGVTRTGS